MGDVFRNLDWSIVTNALYLIIPALVSLTIHELAHGFVAYRLGDPTAKMQGRLTLNPIKHIDPIGLLMMLVARFGWAKPVPVDMRNFKNPKRHMAITALAGPVSNMLLAVIVVFIYGLVFAHLGGRHATGAAEAALIMLQNTVYLSVMFAIFNLIPIPPLDGSKILFSFLPNRAYNVLMRYERFGMLILIALIWFGIFRDTVVVALETVFIWLLENVGQPAADIVSGIGR